MKVLTQLINDLFENLTNSILSAGTKDNLLKASFAKKKSLLSPKHSGFAIGLDAFTIEQSHSHLMCCAPSSGGKTTKVILPSIFQIATSAEQGSMVVNDVKNEIYPKVKPFLLSQGYTVLKLDFRDPANSIAFNPFSYALAPTELNKICNLLAGEEQQGSDPFWRQQAVNLINTIATYLKKHEDVKYQNIANIHYILEHLAAEEDTINNLYSQNAENDLWLRYKTLHANSERTKASIISSAISYLSHYALDADICDVTSSPNSFNFSRLKSEKIALFISLPIHNNGYYTRLIGMFFDIMFNHLFSDVSTPNSRKLYVIIDELAQIPLKKFEDIISIARSYFAILFVVQSTEQLYEKYGQHGGNVILNNCTGIYFTGLRHESQMLQELCGSYNYYPDVKNKNNIQQRHLLSAQEVRTMPKDNALIVPNGGLKPIYIKNVKPWYKVRKYIEYVNMINPDEFALPLPHQRYRTKYLPLDAYRNNDEQQ
ncbi:MAG: type IV secretory system conjugative DNA transfer family protein [Bacteroidota bacterium]